MNEWMNEGALMSSMIPTNFFCPIWAKSSKTRTKNKPKISSQFVCTGQRREVIFGNFVFPGGNLWSAALTSSTWALVMAIWECCFRARRTKVVDTIKPGTWCEWATSCPVADWRRQAIILQTVRAAEPNLAGWGEDATVVLLRTFFVCQINRLFYGPITSAAWGRSAK